MTYRLVVKDEFSDSPAGRLPIHDDANGQLFRQTVLREALKKHTHVTVDFTGVKTIVGSSFLDEAFAGLVYHDGFTEEQVKARLDIIIPSDPSKVATAWAWVRQAEETLRPPARPTTSPARRSPLQAVAY